MKISIGFILLVLFFIQSQAQDSLCNLKFEGIVKDPHDNLLLEFANIYFEETGSYAETDSAGYFLISGICPGTYHILVSHIGCETQKMYFKILSDTAVEFLLEHHAHYLQSVTVTGTKNKNEAATQNTITQNELTRASGKPLASILENIPGLNSIKNGSGIAKPVIHGLTGNRVSMVNNGIVQAGQQWGSDHAPEIDPFIAQQITVLKGVDVITYGGNSLGGLVLMEPGQIEKDPHLHGATQLNFQTNGNVIYQAVKMEQSKKAFDWRITGGIKIGGDHRSPDYYLSNTGLKEYSGSLQWSKTQHNHLNHRVYYSLFHTELGILRSSHIGNLTDLEKAIGSETPFFTKDCFSYAVESPRQKVTHHLFKVAHQWSHGNHLSEIIYAAQLNHRREYDIRRGSRSDIPSLNLLLQSYQAEYKNHCTLNHKEIQYGVQYKFNYNYNQPGTGVFPLIPNYFLNNVGVYSSWKYKLENITYEFGGRYDLNLLNVDYYSATLPVTILNRKHSFHNYSLAAGLKYAIFNKWTSKLNIGWTQRAPEVNELYSFGLHQAVAGIEEGNSNLQSERSLKIILTNTVSMNDHISFEFSTYYQHIANFIFLEPQKEFRLTIRGAFPLFIYKQTDGIIYGLDALCRVEFLSRWQWINSASLLRGYDTKLEEGLVYMPPDHLRTALSYQFPNNGKLKNIKLELNGKYVFKQNNLNAEKDFLAAPSAYLLAGSLIEAEFKLFNQQFKTSIQVENLLNKKYRDYLNRLRYFADEEGLNVRLNLRMNF